MKTDEEQQKSHDEYVARQNVRNKVVMEEAAKILFAGTIETRDGIIEQLRSDLGADMVDNAIDDLTTTWTLDWLARNGPHIFKGKDENSRDN